jgi:hypothetical protein
VTQGAVIDRYLKTAEVAKDGKLPHSRTLGGHRRFPADPIEQLAKNLSQAL